MGSWYEYEIPFQLQLTAFSFGLGDCCPEFFKFWTFEAFDGEDWRGLLYSARPPEPYDHEVFELVSAADFASTRFRIRLTEIEWEDPEWEDDHDDRCMHICGLELFGTIMPPWRLDEYIRSTPRADDSVRPAHAERERSRTPPPLRG